MHLAFLPFTSFLHTTCGKSIVLINASFNLIPDTFTIGQSCESIRYLYFYKGLLKCMQKEEERKKRLVVLSRKLILFDKPDYKGLQNYMFSVGFLSPPTEIHRRGYLHNQKKSFHFLLKLTEPLHNKQIVYNAALQEPVPTPTKVQGKSLNDFNGNQMRLLNKYPSEQMERVFLNLLILCAIPIGRSMINLCLL